MQVTHLSDTISQVRQYYTPMDIMGRLRAALRGRVADDQPLTVQQIAALDQLHTRGIPATEELAVAAGITLESRVLDLGCGVGGPARCLAEECGCRVIGVDLSPAFIEAAAYLTSRCGLSERVSFQTADALHLPFRDGSFDAVFLQHVVMNIRDRSGLYAQIRRVLVPGGRLATYDLVLRAGDLVYPVPWAAEASTSFLIDEGATRVALVRSGFRVLVWRDETLLALEWVKSVSVTGTAPGGLSPAVVMGEDFPRMFANLACNLREGRIGVLTAVLIRA
jgi:SAM-dependent methyltransferase